MTSIITNSTNSDVQQKYHLICDNISKFPSDCWDQLHYFITNNPGKPTEYYVKNYKDHAFTVTSFEFLIKQINENRNTFHGIGPFVNKKGLWYCKSKTKYDLISIINYQQKEIDRLKGVLHEMHLM